VLRVFRDAAEENPGIQLIEEDAFMDVKIGVGMYIVREDAKADLKGTLKKLKQIGYDGAELLGFFGATPEALREMLEDLNLVALGDHVALNDFSKDPDRVLRDHLAIGCRYITLSYSKDYVASKPFEALTEEFSKAAQRCLASGVTPMYHNGDFDMKGDEPFAQRILDAVPALHFEPDVGWMAVAGADPVPYLERYRSRTPVVHLKDVFLSEGGFSFRPTGYGSVNNPRLMPAILGCNPEWLAVDHDLAYGRDPYDDLALSFQYVKTLCALEP
jgi:sugar phosphate isomerase/epimerase